MGKFCHLVLTKFNVKTVFGKSAVADADWLFHRFNLFEKICYPSVLGQTNLNFKWLVFFDVDTPNSFKKKIDYYATWEKFIPYYVDSMTSNIAHQDIVRENIAPGSKFLITTRLDNDDGVSRDFIESIQRNFASQEFEFINFTNGYTLDFNKAKLYMKSFHSNPFISLIESVENFKTVWCGEHTKLDLVGTVREIETEPLWITVVHDRNVSNRVGPALRIPMTVLGKKFKLDYEYDQGPKTFLIANLINRIGMSFPKPIKLLLRRLYSTLLKGSSAYR